MPWLVLGDFNDMINESDKKEIHKHHQALLDGYKKIIEDCGLIELDLTGGKFIWEKSRGSSEWVRERIDRDFASGSWWQLHPLYKLTLSHTFSDHDPIQVHFYSTEHSRKNFRFGFENTWLKEKAFNEEVTNYWLNLDPLYFLPNLLELSCFMKKWGHKFFNNFREKIKRKNEVISFYEGWVNEDQTKRYFEERSKVEELLTHEEAYWKQREQSFRLQDGDSNFKFFHAFAMTRKRRRKITKLRADSGELVTDQKEMCNVIMKYFKTLFSSSELLQGGELSPAAPLITEDQNKCLVEEFTFEEFFIAVKEMHPNKSAGPDGLNPTFYQNF